MKHIAKKSLILLVCLTTVMSYSISGFAATHVVDNNLARTNNSIAAFVELGKIVMDSTVKESIGVETIEDEPIGVYEYPVTSEDAEWNSLGSVSEKIEVCRIPNDELESMSDEQLVQAVLDFPFLYDIFAAPNFEVGVSSLEEISDAYYELIGRESAKDALYAALLQLGEDADLSVEDEIKMDALAVLIIYQDVFQYDMNIDELETIGQLSSMIEVSATDELETAALAETVPVTPNGTLVAYITKTCDHENDSATYHATLDAEYADEYGITIISNGSCKYNCHSYAWYSQSTSNIYWIEDPSAYMTDGSYSRVISGLGTFSSSVVLGDRVFYGSSSLPLHSAIITSAAIDVPLATRIVTSKWGKLGVYRHTVSNVPKVYGTNVSAWHR